MLHSQVFFIILNVLSDHMPFIGMLQELEETRVLDFIPDWAYVPTSARLRLPTYTTSQRCDSSRLHPKSFTEYSHSPPLCVTDLIILTSSVVTDLDRSLR